MPIETNLTKREYFAVQFAARLTVVQTDKGGGMRIACDLGQAVDMADRLIELLKAPVLEEPKNPDAN